MQAVVTAVENKINFDTLEPVDAPGTLAMNDIGGIKLRTAKPLVFDGYQSNRLTGSFILIEQGTNLTVGAGMLAPPTEAVKPEYSTSRFDAKQLTPLVFAPKIKAMDL